LKKIAFCTCSSAGLFHTNWHSAVQQWYCCLWSFSYH